MERHLLADGAAGDPLRRPALAGADRLLLLRDGQNWTYGGRPVPGRDLASARASGPARPSLTTAPVDVFYTASGIDNPTGIDPTDALQRLAHAQGRIHADDEGVWFTGFGTTRSSPRPDGHLYQTMEQSQRRPDHLRVPRPVRVPRPDRPPALHPVRGQQRRRGRAPTRATARRSDGSRRARGPAGGRYYTGNIGLMHARRRTCARWELLPPVLSADCTNQQTERPHLVVHDGPTTCGRSATSSRSPRG